MRQNNGFAFDLIEFRRLLQEKSTENRREIIIILITSIRGARLVPAGL